ncbi:hypothetical protein BN12_4060030 [Nostocoides japonicum T1-X7]|uniref:Uncharacterized protein n=1 Tax=Nostocoides japonicum T1-X7 TaxID=1194083 RepID=A0A077M578_9MICO|nr:hypothetical protein BN12_4060030 [Tetrasphaera japonica T1-X7]
MTPAIPHIYLLPLSEFGFCALTHYRPHKHTGRMSMRTLSNISGLQVHARRN